MKKTIKTLDANYLLLDDIVLGVDPGFERVGLAFVKKNSIGKVGGAL